jgi:hypothetical protein
MKPETVQAKRAYIYTNHDATNKLLRERLEQLGYAVSVLQQDRSVQAYVDIMQKTDPGVVIFGVMPIPSVVELLHRNPIVYPAVDYAEAERLTGKRLGPKDEIPAEILPNVIRLRVFDISESARLSPDEFINALKHENAPVAVFNDTLREAVEMVAGIKAVKQAGPNAVHINPLEFSGNAYFISFGNVGKLTSQQMADMIRSGQAIIMRIKGAVHVFTLNEIQKAIDKAYEVWRSRVRI